MKVLLAVVFPVLAAGIFFLLKTDSATVERSVRTGIARELPPDDSAPEGFAVVELFTSEGCSSCPPAEKFLNAIAADADKSGTHVYALAFHVDYWNRLGWNDRFSDSAFSNRQRAYARALELTSVYTPQMIVNGTTEFVGSDRDRGEEEIAAGLKQRGEIGVEVWVKGAENGMLKIGYQLRSPEGGGAKPSERYLLNVALIEKDLETQVKRGENSGRTLQHRNVVRAFVSAPTELPDSVSSGEITLPVPADAVPGNSAVIAYVQEKKSMRIIGAGRGRIQK